MKVDSNKHTKSSLPPYRDDLHPCGLCRKGMITSKRPSQLERVQVRPQRSVKHRLRKKPAEQAAPPSLDVLHTNSQQAGPGDGVLSLASCAVIRVLGECLAPRCAHQEARCALVARSGPRAGFPRGAALSVTSLSAPRGGPWRPTNAVLPPWRETQSLCWSRELSRDRDPSELILH